MRAPWLAMHPDSQRYPAQLPVMLHPSELSAIRCSLR
jgi:hypothetical protein